MSLDRLPRLVQRRDEKPWIGKFHGRTFKNDKLLIIEDSNGTVHVVNECCVRYAIPEERTQ